MSKALMIQATGSDAGKSLFCAGLIRHFKRQGVKALPFKPQNMSNNAAVAQGGEIGRAQALQAQAAGVPATVDMNPILLKPQGDSVSQIIVQGQLWGQAKGSEYYSLKEKLMPFVEDSFKRISKECDIVIVEGAGSPAEVNLREGDIANMGFATHFDVPVVLLGDIERGGVIANLVGTYHLLTEAERNLIKGFVINKFRGDIRLFDSAIDIIKESTGWESYGVLPWLEELQYLPQEDALGLQTIKSQKQGGKGKGEGGRFHIGALQLPHIANFDDLDALRAEADVRLTIIEAGQAVPADLDALLILGSKATLSDYRTLCKQGWDIDIYAHVRRGGIVVGLCGGYQMLGLSIEDRFGLEGKKEAVQTLGLLNIKSVLGDNKHLAQTAAKEHLFGFDIDGYEIHLGQSFGEERVFMESHDGQVIGHINSSQRVIGCYLHGLFGNDNFRKSFLSMLGDYTPSYDSHNDFIEQILDKLAEHLSQNCNIDKLLE